jgi:hypothetical protein
MKKQANGGGSVERRGALWWVRVLVGSSLVAPGAEHAAAA